MNAGAKVDGRLCAIRKSEQAIERARRCIERPASKRQSKTKAVTWEYPEYVPCSLPI